MCGIGFGLPYRYHPDEFQYVEDALGFLDGDPTPERLNNPTLHKFVLAVEYAVLGRLAGRAVEGDDVGALAPFYGLGRLTSALLGAATVPLVWWLGTRAYNPTVGWLAALFLAVAFMPVRESHFATNDAAVTFLTVIALGLSLAVSETATRGRSLRAGLVTGLAAATKYTGAILVVPLAAAHLWRAVADRQRGRVPTVAACLALAVLATALAYLAGNPYTVLAPDRFLEDVGHLIGRGQQGYKGQILDPAGGWIFFLKSLRWGLGPLLFALCVAGVVRALIRPSRADIVLASFALAVYAFHARQLMFFARFILPAVPVLVVLGARLLDEAVTRAVPDARRRRLALAALCVPLMLPPAVSAARFDYLLLQTDTRTQANTWIEAHVPPGSTIVTEPYGPPIDGARYDVEQTDSEGLAWHDHTLDTYRQAGAAWLVASSFVFERRYADPAVAARLAAFYDDLATQGELAAEFRPYDTPDAPPFEFTQVYGPVTDLFAFDRPGPVILVYRLGAP